MKKLIFISIFILTSIAGNAQSQGNAKYDYKVYKELERIIRISRINLSVDKVLDIAKTIATIDIKTGGVPGGSKRTLFLTEEQMNIKPLFDLKGLLGD